MVLGLEEQHSKWILLYFPISWITQFGHGTTITVVGPTQPYLAKNTGVDISTINFVWTFGFFGYIVGSLVTGFIFKQYLVTERAKLWFLFSSIFITGAVMIVLPFTSSFTVLVLARLVQNLALGAFTTADASLIVYLIGPEKSRPFTMAFHACIGVGFLVATFLVRPFLPEASDNNADICGTSNYTGSMGSTEPVAMVDGVQGEIANRGIPQIAWPFIITGTWCMVFSLGFIILEKLPFKMPKFYGKDEDDQEKQEKQEIKYVKTFLVLIFFYFFVSCGIERIYQPMAFTFGICGPLALQPREAVVIDSCYNGGFMCGRLSSALVAIFVKPRNMILISLVFSVAVTIMLCAVASTSVMGLYIGTAILGFFISWQFGSCFSWVAKKMNITGRLSSLFFVGCGVGSLTTPPLSGFIFSSLGPMSIIHLTLFFCLLQCALFGALWILSRVKENSSSNSYMLEGQKSH